MSSTSISIICAGPKETAINISGLSRLLASLEPEVLAAEGAIVAELMTAIDKAALSVAASIPYPEPKPARTATRRARPDTRTAFDLTDTRTPAAGWNLVTPDQAH